MRKNDPRYQFRLAMLALGMDVSHTSYADIYVCDRDYFGLTVTAELTADRTGIASVEWRVTDRATLPLVLQYGQADSWIDARHLIEDAVEYFARATGDEGDDHMTARVW